MAFSSVHHQPPCQLDEIQQLQATIATLEEKNQQLSEEVKQLIITENKFFTSQTQLDNQAAAYRKLYELGRSLSQVLELPAVLDLAKQFVIYELGFERCLLLLFNSDLNCFEVKDFDGYYEDEDMALVQTLQLPASSPMLSNLGKPEGYEVCTATCNEPHLTEGKSLLGMDEYTVFVLRQEINNPLGLLIAGNTLERAIYQTRVSHESDELLGLANAASQITTSINSVNFYHALNEERSLLEHRVQSRTQDLNQKNTSLQSTLQTLQQTQAQLVQSEKMSGLGHLVAGIAHEINNPVNFISGNLEYAANYTQDLLTLIAAYQRHHSTPHAEIKDILEDIDLNFLSDDLPKLMDSMKMGADRIKEIVLSLRTFSRMDEAEMKAVNIHEGLDSSLLILKHKLKGCASCEPIEVIKHYGNLPQIECYAGQLNQVFMNLLTNAIDALDEHRESRKRETSIRSTEKEERLAATISITTTAHSDYVLIEIADNGPGIPEHIQENIFNPFFTTKPVGQGTGLGLSISYQIVCDRHGGNLSCQSTEGQGTCVLIKIPMALTK